VYRRVVFESPDDRGLTYSQSEPGECYVAGCDNPAATMLDWPEYMINTRRTLVCSGHAGAESKQHPDAKTEDIPDGFVGVDTLTPETKPMTVKFCGEEFQALEIQTVDDRLGVAPETASGAPSSVPAGDVGTLALPNGLKFEAELSYVQFENGVVLWFERAG